MEFIILVLPPHDAYRRQCSLERLKATMAKLPGAQARLFAAAWVTCCEEYRDTDEAAIFSRLSLPQRAALVKDLLVGRVWQ